MSPEKPTSAPNQTQESTAWDSLSKVEFAPSSQPEKPEALAASEATDVRELLRRRALEDVNLYTKDIKETQKTFATRLKNLESEGKAFMPRKEFEVWEADFADRWEKVKSSLEKSGAGADRFSAAKLEDQMIPPQYRGQDNPNLGLTIEAQSGRYFGSRYVQLLRAISEAPADKKASAEAILKHFDQSVDEHLNYKYMPPDERQSFSGQQYWAERSRAHNEVIETLNKMNALAEEYGVKRFTPRDFWSGNFAPDKSRRTPEVEDRIQYDRGIVEAFYDYAFSSDVARRKTASGY
ncbi:hypothetical protein IJG10_01920 [Candidatus Saccharibacteria bacterium]|nr:hypothetical protein [Candidatus Saccharibacteria bacterium]MBQ6147650.1 hypothetical protein [Candidatus Saccharibacteria bacterium]